MNRAEENWYTCGYCASILHNYGELILHGCFGDYDENIQNIVNDADFVVTLENKEGTDVAPDSKEQNNGASTWSLETEESLISLIMHRSAIYDSSLPLVARSRANVAKLWEEVKAELGGMFSVPDLKSKWKSIRDSYMRVRATTNKKLTSGTDNEELLALQKIQNNHKHYHLLTFLDDSLRKRRTVTNVELESPIISSPASPCSSASSLAALKKKKREDELTTADKQFLEVISNISNPTNQQLSATEHFLLSLAPRMDKLPSRERSKLQIKFMELLCEEEEMVTDT